MTAQLSPWPRFQAFGPNGQFLVGGKLFTYGAGTSTPQATYIDSTQITPNTNPVILDAMGSAPVWLDPTKTYKYVLQDSTGNPIFTTDNINSPPVANWANVLTFGADPTGVSDSSTAVQNAANSGARFVLIPPPNPGASYIIHDVVIPSGVTVFMEGAYIVDAVGANWVFKLVGFNTKLIGGQISSAANCSQAAVIVDDGNWCEVRSIRVINGTTILLLKSSSNGSNGFGCARTQLSDIQGIAYSGVGVDSAANCHDTQAVNINMDSNTVVVSGGQTPKPGAIGFRFTGTGSTVAFGGHMYANCCAINMQTGWSFVNANLCKLSSCIADSLSGAAYFLSGNSNACDLDSCFAGTCAVSILATNTSRNNMVRGLRSFGTGQIPSFGAPTWYSSAGFAAPFFDISAFNTATVAVNLDDWISSNSTVSHTISEAVPGNVQMLGGIVISFTSNTTVAAGTTIYLGQNGQSAAENSQQILLPLGLGTVALAVRSVFDCDTAPGAGQSFTYTVRVNAASTAIVGTTAGAGVFTATVVGGAVGIFPGGQSVDIQLVTSAGANAAVHRGYLILLPQPG